MLYKDYTEEIKNQVEFLKKLREDSPNDNLKAKIDSALEKIYTDAIARIDPTVRIPEAEKEIEASSAAKKLEDEVSVKKAKEEKEDAEKKLREEKQEAEETLGALSKEFNDAQKDTRKLTYLNLFFIIVMILAFFYMITKGYGYTSDMIKPYIESEDTKNKIVDSLSSHTALLQRKVLERLDSATTKLPTDKEKYSVQDSSTQKFIDSARSTINYMESTLDKLDKRPSNFSKVQNAIIFYISLVIASIFAGIVVLVYLVRLLVNIHRYNSILADHYEALGVAFRTLKNKKVFGDNYDLEKAYTVVHPQRDKIFEMYSAQDMSTKEIEDMGTSNIKVPGINKAGAE
jgi:uncharacterized membrane protein (DUF106 family)